MLAAADLVNKWEPFAHQSGNLTVTRAYCSFLLILFVHAFFAVCRFILHTYVPLFWQTYSVRRELQQNLPSANPLTKGHLLSWDTFAWHGLVINCKCPVIREQLSNMDRGYANHKIFCLLFGMRGQFASCEYPLNINFNSEKADFIDLARNLLCGSAQNGRGGAGSNTWALICFPTTESVHG